MRAWQINDFRAGLDKALLLSQTNKPPPPENGQVLVKVLAMGLNPADYKLIELWPSLSKLLFGRTLVPGFDFCGQVV